MKKDIGGMFVTEDVAGGHMIQLGGEKHDALWLTPSGQWTPCVFEAASFPKKEQAQACLVLTILLVSALFLSKKAELEPIEDSVQWTSLVDGYEEQIISVGGGPYKPTGWQRCTNGRFSDGRWPSWNTRTGEKKFLV